MPPFNKRPNRSSFLTRSKRRLVKWSPWIKRSSPFFIFILLVWVVIQIASPLSKIGQKIFFGPNLFFSTLFNWGSLKEENGRTNFLLLGVGGASHEGPNLTDTMIFASVNTRTGDTLLLSIPRDIWIDSLKQKINTAYAIGEAKKKGGGIILAKDAVYEITGRPIHYVLVIDFDVFEKAIDSVGGIDVYVERTFDDYKYPKENGEWEAATGSGEIYERLHFEKGWQHMDGVTALKFTRSRNSEDENEGTDFARSKRQQKIIFAFKEKVFSKKTLFDLPKIIKTAKTFQENIDTDIKEENLPKLSRLALKFEEKKLRTISLNEGTKEKPGFLKNPPVEDYGTWVLVPRSGKWVDFQKFLNKEIERK